MTADPGFLGFAKSVLADSGQVPARHHEALISRLDAVLDGSCDRLMVQMPPGYAKSTYGSVLFPAYFLSRFGDGQIIAASHTASLAEHFGRQVRRLILDYGEALGVQLARDSRAVGRFSLASGGGYFAAGVRGPITGRRADLILIDDPIKSWAEAESSVCRDALYDWYRAELTARLKPHGRVVLLMTRWHEDDLAGRLLRGAGAWQNLRLPALAQPDDPLGRPMGAALWSTWQDEAAIMRRRAEVGERAFAALYQQQPRPPEDGLFDVKKISVLETAPDVVRSIRAWDLAASLPATGRSPDYTVGLKLGVTAAKMLIVLDVIRFQGSPATVMARIKAAAEADGVQTVVALPQDPGQAGVAQVALLTAELLGYHVDASVESGAKLTRAMPAATQIDAGRLAVVGARWNIPFLDELAAFPQAPKDDQVDALSRAVSRLAALGTTATRRTNVALMGR